MTPTLTRLTTIDLSDPDVEELEDWELCDTVVNPLFESNELVAPEELNHWVTVFDDKMIDEI